MGIQVQGNGGVIAEVDGTTFRALRITQRPVDYGALGFYRINGWTGTMAVSLAAAAQVFHARWTDATRLALIYKLIVAGIAPLAAATGAALSCQLESFMARAWTVDGSGGTVATITGNNQKERTSMGTTLFGAIRWASTTGLTAGTVTIDTHGHGGVIAGVGTAAITAPFANTVMPRIALLDADGEGQHPTVLVQNEGLGIRVGTIAFPAGMTWNGGFGMVWAEAAAF